MSEKCLMFRIAASFLQRDLAAAKFVAPQLADVAFLYSTLRMLGFKIPHADCSAVLSVKHLHVWAQISEIWAQTWRCFTEPLKEVFRGKNNNSTLISQAFCQPNPVRGTTFPTPNPPPPPPPPSSVTRLLSGQSLPNPLTLPCKRCIVYKIITSSMNLYLSTNQIWYLLRRFWGHRTNLVTSHKIVKYHRTISAHATAKA